MAEHPWKRNYPPGGDDFDKIEINIPREMKTWLEGLAGKFKVPPWRLVCIALDNERDEPQPFLYPLEIPNTTYVEHAYTEEGHKIYQFLQKFKFGLGRDVLMMFRRQIGIPNKLTLLLALREILNMKMVHETENFRKRSFMEYPLGYKHIMVVKMPMASPQKIWAEKKKLEKLKRGIEKLEKKVELMEGNRDGIRSARAETPDSEKTEE